MASPFLGVADSSRLLLGIKVVCRRPARFGSRGAIQDMQLKCYDAALIVCNDLDNGQLWQEQLILLHLPLQAE